MRYTVPMKRNATLLACLLLAACDSHRAVVDDDGGVTDGAVKDGPWMAPDKTRPPDRKRPPDKLPRDSCLPLPSKSVQGSYGGSWKGVLKCPGLGGNSNISGSMQFTLSPASAPEAFTVKGSMSGTVTGYMPFTSSISGSMGCTQLLAALPDIKVGAGGVGWKGKGSMKGTFTVQKGTRLFRAGSWSAKETNSLCTAAGTWAATHK